MSNVMRFRKLRIAFSALCGFACLLLITFWARSFSMRDEFHKVSATGYSGFAIDYGNLELVWATDPTLAPAIGTGWHRTKYYGFYSPRHWFWLMVGGFAVDKDNIAIPLWSLLLLIATFAIVPWIRWKWHFSLRTLLIAMTLVAVVLGLAVYAARK